MAVEIERKFLVTGDGWRRNIQRQETLRQGYLSTAGFASVRIRIQGDEAYLNIKQAVMGRERLEFDYGIPMEDAVEMLAALCEQPLIEKTRYWVGYGGFTWEVDVFHGDNAGLVIAELELESATQDFPRPDWLGREVTDQKRYYNVSLSEHPYCEWTGEERQA